MARRPSTAPESGRGYDSLLSRPPSTAMFLAGLSAYPYEQFVQKNRSSYGKTNVFMTTATQAGMDSTGTSAPRTVEQRKAAAAAAAAAAEISDRAEAQAVRTGALGRLPPTATERAWVPPPMPPTPVSEYQEATSLVSQPTADFRPKYVTHDGLVLRFFVYYKEKIEGSAIEKERVRPLELLYYLVDDTLQLSAPRQENSGLPAGTVLSRQVAFRDIDLTQVTPRDLTIGAELVLFGRKYHIVDADKRTRAWMTEKLGIVLGDAQDMPANEYVPPAIEMEHRPRPSKIYADLGYEENPELGFYHRRADTLEQFLKYDRDVLSFEAEWDDTHRMFGERRTFQLNLYLADDTADLVERNDGNSGRDPFPRLVNRMHLPLPADEMPKSVSAVLMPDEGHKHKFHASAGAGASNTVVPTPVGVLPPRPPKHVTDFPTKLDPISGRPVYEMPKDAPHPARPYTPLEEGQDAAVWPGDAEPGHVHAGIGVLAAGASLGNGGGGARAGPFPPPTYYTAPKLLCGKTIRVFGRTLHLKSCDGFTKAWYKENLGVTQIDAPDARVSYSSDKVDDPSAMSWEDPGVPLEVLLRQAGVPELAPAPIHTVGERKALDLVKFNDFGGKTLRFMARLVSDNPIAQGRRFIVSYFLVDDTLSVFEPAVLNCGVVTGKFLERAQYRNARAPLESVVEHSGVHRRPRRFSPSDFGVGALIEFEHAKGQQFELLEADKFTLDFLAAAASASAVSGSDAKAALAPSSKFKQLRAALEEVTWCLTGRLNSFGKMLESFDYSGTGVVARAIAEGMLGRMGAAPPAVNEAAFRSALDQFATADGEGIRHTEMVRAMGQCRVAAVARPKTAPAAPPAPPKAAAAAASGAGAGAATRAGAGAGAGSNGAADAGESSVLAEVRSLVGSVPGGRVAGAFSSVDTGGTGIISQSAFFEALRRAGSSAATGSQAGRAATARLTELLFPSAASCLDYRQFVTALYGSK